MAKRNEVDLVVKARNEASKTLKAIVQAFEDFKATLDTANDSTAKGNSALGGLASTLAELNRKAASFKALDSVAKNLDEVSAAAVRMDKTVRNSTEELGRMAVDAALAADRTKQLRAGMEQEQATLKALAADRLAANKHLTESKKALDQAEAAQRRYNKARDQKPMTTAGVGIEAGLTQSSARKSAAAFLEADVQAANRALVNAREFVTLYDTEIKKVKGSVELYGTAVKAAAEQQRRLDADVAKKNGGLRQERAELENVRAELEQVKGVEAELIAITGQQVAAQAKVTDAYKKTADEIERVSRLASTMSKFSTGNGDFTDQRTAASLQRQNSAVVEARENWKTLEAEAKRLAGSINTVSGNATQQVNAFRQVIAAARQAKVEYTSQVQALDSMRAAAGLAASGLGRVRVEVAGVAAAAHPADTALRGAANSMAEAARSSTSLSQSIRRTNSDSRQSLSLYQRIRGEVLALAASYVGLQGGAHQLAEVVEATNQLQAAQSRLNVAFNSDRSQVGKELRFLETQADRLGITFDVLSEQYSKFAVAARTANFSGEATRDIFLSIAEAGKVQRLSIDQLQGVFKALEQIISKGKVQAEELRGQLGDRMTGAFQIFAQAIGVTTAELDDMLKKGEVIASEDNLSKLGNRLREIYGPQLAEALKNTNAEMGRFSNNLFQAQLRVGEGGFVEAFTDGLQKLNEAMRSREGRDFFLALGSALAKVTNLIVAATPYFDDFATVIGVIVGLKAARWFQTFVSGLTQTVTATASSNAAMFTWAGNVAAMQGRWNALVASLRVGTGAIHSARNSMAAIAISANTAGVSFTAMRVGLSALQAVAGVAAGVFRALWLAIGGVPGLILTGITVAVGGWLTSVKDTTAAIDEHKRIMSEVVAAYQAAADKSGDWAKNIKNATLDQMTANLRTLRSQAVAAMDAVSDVSHTFAASALARSNPGQFALATQMRDLQHALRDGKIDISDFVTQMEALFQQTTDDGVRQYGEALLAAGRSAREAAQRVTEMEIAAKAAGDATIKAAGTVEDLVKAQEKSADAATKAAERSEKFKTALEAMGDLVPKIGKELEALGEIDALNKLFQDAAKAAGSFGELYQATQLYNQGLQGIVGGALGSNSSFVDMVVGLESSGNATIKNKDSSATGLGQFIKSTWVRMFKQYFPDVVSGFQQAGLEGKALDQRILQYRTDPSISKQMIALYAQENAKYLAQQGISASNMTLYLAHFLGAGDAAKVLKANASTPIQGLVNQDSINSNQSVLGGGKTVGDVIAWASRKTGITKEELAAKQQIDQLDTKAAADTAKRLSDAEAEVAQQKLIAAGKAKQAEMDKAEREARAANPNISDEDIAKLRELIGLEYDLKNVKTEQKQEQQAANQALREAQALYQQQIALQAQLKQMQGMGDAAGAETTRLKLTEVNAEFEKAIARARAMWEAIGGDAATTAIAKLDTLSTKIQTATNRTNSFGLTSQQVSGFVDNFASGIANAFGSFAQAVVNGENAFKAFGQAVLQTLAQMLQQIAVAILRMMILRALSGMGGGIGAAATGLLNGGVSHSGGIAGSSNRSRKISAATMGAPFVYHKGGVAGLKSNEVFSVLERGETIRTEEQEEALAEKQAAAERAMNQTAGGIQTLRNIITLDEDSAAQFLTSATGEKAIWGVLSKNKGKLRGLMG